MCFFLPMRFSPQVVSVSPPFLCLRDGVGYQHQNIRVFIQQLRQTQIALAGATRQLHRESWIKISTTKASRKHILEVCCQAWSYVIGWMKSSHCDCNDLFQQFQQVLPSVESPGLRGGKLHIVTIASPYQIQKIHLYVQHCTDKYECAYVYFYASPLRDFFVTLKLHL